MSFFSDASLVYVPSGVKDAKTYSIKPTDGSGDLTFSRGSDIEATRVNANGYIEKAKVNLSKNSQTGANWTASGATIDSTSVADFLGGTDAVTYTAVGGSAAYVFSDNTISVPSGGVFTGSIYVKNVDANYVQLTFSTAGFGSAQYRNFDLTNGSLGGGLGIDGKIEDVGSGWYRISLTASATSSSTVASIIAVIVPSASASRLQAATTGQTLTAFGFQFNYGLVAQEYQETTTAAVVTGITNDMPRLSYDPANPTCPSLLLEPSRTNAIPQSEYFGSGWVANDCTLDFGYLAPDGTNSAYKITDGGSGSLVYSGVADQNYSRTIYARTTSGTGTAQLCSYFGNTNNTFTITEEWQRFEINTTTTTTGATNFYAVDFRGAATLTEIIIWGAQSENATYATSYIPTYGTSATRTADACSKTGISSLIGQTEGTLFVEFTIDRGITSTDRVAILSDGTGNERIGISLGATNLLYAFVVDGGTTTAEIVRSGTTAGTYKAAFAYKGNDFAFYVNGSLVGTDTSGSVASCSRLDLGNQLGASPLGGEISQTLLFTSRLSNADLATLTA